jgi:uncharacterized protein with NRDE domain
MVTAWLTSPNDEGIEHFVHRLLEGDGVKGVGGFSLFCGKLRRRRDNAHEIEPMAIISNRSGSPDQVPWICGNRDEVYGLSNTSYLDPDTWPKVRMGKEKVLEAVKHNAENGLGEQDLVDALYAVLDTDTLPAQNGETFEEYIYQLRKSIFIPPIGNPDVPPEKAHKADQIAAARPTTIKPIKKGDSEESLKEEETPCEETNSGMTGVYGTQRQTIILVDWDGNVSFRERSLWDEKGHPIERGHGDMRFQFMIEGWHGESKGNAVQPHAVL